MVGIVLVSHSARLADGLAELLAQLAPQVTVVAAGGADDGSLGTSPDRVAEAVAGADSGDGVLVIPDLGSSVLTARLVIADAVGGRAALVDAPFVEGAVAAGVTAATGAGLDAVAAAAEKARDYRKL